MPPHSAQSRPLYLALRSGVFFTRFHILFQHVRVVGDKVGDRLDVGRIAWDGRFKGVYREIVLFRIVRVALKGLIGVPEVGMACASFQRDVTGIYSSVTSMPRRRSSSTTARIVSCVMTSLPFLRS